MPSCIKCHQPQRAALVICPECVEALTERTERTEKMVQNLTCFKCHHDTAVLTYEENRIYKIACHCGCEYSFEHSSMAAAQMYHAREVELHGEIDRNARLTAQLAEKERQLVVAVELIQKLERCFDVLDAATQCIKDNPVVDHTTRVAQNSIINWRGAQAAGEGEG